MFYELMLVVGANGKRIGTYEIQNKLLVNFGIKASLRTIQRDLNLLQDHFCRLQSDKCSPQGWFFAKDEESQFIAELLKEVA